MGSVDLVITLEEEDERITTIAHWTDPFRAAQAGTKLLPGQLLGHPVRTTLHEGEAERKKPHQGWLSPKAPCVGRNALQQNFDKVLLMKEALSGLPNAFVPPTHKSREAFLHISASPPSLLTLAVISFPECTLLALSLLVWCKETLPVY